MLSLQGGIILKESYLISHLNPSVKNNLLYIKMGFNFGFKNKESGKVRFLKISWWLVRSFLLILFRQSPFSVPPFFRQLHRLLLLFPPSIPLFPPVIFFHLSSGSSRVNPYTRLPLSLSPCLPLSPTRKSSPFASSFPKTISRWKGAYRTTFSFSALNYTHSKKKKNFPFKFSLFSSASPPKFFLLPAVSHEKKKR